MASVASANSMRAFPSLGRSKTTCALFSTNAVRPEPANGAGYVAPARTFDHPSNVTVVERAPRPWCTPASQRARGVPSRLSVAISASRSVLSIGTCSASDTSAVASGVFIPTSARRAALPKFASSPKIARRSRSICAASVFFSAASSSALRIASSPFRYALSTALRSVISRLATRSMIGRSPRTIVLPGGSSLRRSRTASKTEAVSLV